MFICNKCGEKYNSNWGQCAKCNGVIINEQPRVQQEILLEYPALPNDVNFCTNCGWKLSKRQNFCSMCGERISCVQNSIIQGKKQLSPELIIIIMGIITLLSVAIFGLFLAISPGSHKTEISASLSPQTGSVSVDVQDYFIARNQVDFKEMMLFLNNKNQTGIASLGARERIRTIDRGTNVTVLDFVFVDSTEAVYIEVNGGEDNGIRGYVPAKILMR